ncbi:hypothetical protein [Streptomyces sp900105755]|uniref:SMODS and SLOG-associating 2TM effector domain-containing protein n=1 Tax=Streptomyces sp. 900105755 TaxID=3154389 RepID=A0ABV1TWZ2_9ACTN
MSAFVITAVPSDGSEVSVIGHELSRVAQYAQHAGSPAAAAVATVSLLAGALITVAGRDLVNGILRWMTSPAQRQLRWLLKHDYVEGKLTPQQVVDLTAAALEQEMRTHRAVLAPKSGDGGVPQREEPLPRTETESGGETSEAADGQ